jgi:hypothetical protein
MGSNWEMVQPAGSGAWEKKGALCRKDLSTRSDLAEQFLPFHKHPNHGSRFHAIFGIYKKLVLI